MGGGGIPIISPIIKIVTGIVDVITSAVGIGPVFNKPEVPATYSYAGSYEASSIVAAPVYVPPPPSAALGSFSYEQPPNPGVRQQLSPQTDNKIPVVYGTSYLGGTIIDLTISNNNQDIYYVFALSEVTNSEFGNTPDNFSFGNIYWGGKKVNFQGNGYTVASLFDESTNLTDSTVDGKMDFYLYKNGSSKPANTTLTAIDVLSNTDLVYKWDSTKLMSNTVFAIVHLRYSQSANITGLQQTRFQITNSRSAPGDCFTDYLSSVRYGAAVPTTQIDNASIAALNTYSNALFTYTNFAGTTSTQKRFVFNGYLNTANTIMTNLQNMASCCDCLIRYNEITARWGVIPQTPNYFVSMDLDDSVLTSSINISPLDTSSTFNVTEVKFSDGAAKDVFDSATYDLAKINPSLLYPNEPVNKQSVDLPLVNNSVQAQYICNRVLQAAREDLQVRVSINFTGLQLEAGDIVTLTNANYGWTKKLFRVSKVTENIADDGAITCSLTLLEFNPAIFSDSNITQFTPLPNTGIADPSFFGTIPAPVFGNVVNSGYQPLFEVLIRTSSAGITQYAELWYSTVSNPSIEQLIFAGTSVVRPSGLPYGINELLPAINFTTLETGNYYFFSRMRNSLRASSFSPASKLFVWDPVWIDDVTGFYSQGDVFDWNDVYSANLLGYIIKFNYGTNFDWNSGNPLFKGYLTNSNYMAAGLPATVITVMIKALDTLGHESRTAANFFYTGASGLNNNIIYSYDFKANNWPGTIVGGTIVGGNIAANNTDSFYGLDDQSFFDVDALSFYELSSTAMLTYTSAPITLSTALAGSNGELFTTIVGNSVTIEYLNANSGSFYDAADSASFYGLDTVSFYTGNDASWVPLPGLIGVSRELYQFRITIGSGTQGQISMMNFLVDAPIITENLPNYVVNNNALVYTKPFTAITTVLVTLQKNALNVVSMEVDKTNVLAPVVTGYTAAHIATAGAKADISLIGY